MAINQRRPDTPLAATPEPRYMAVNDSIKPKTPITLDERKAARRFSDSIKKEKLKKIYSKTYEETKKPGQSYDDWYNKYNEQTKINSFKAKEPKGERTYFAGDNGPKGKCEGYKCSGSK